MKHFLRNIKFLSIVGGAFVLGSCDLDSNDQPVPDVAYVSIYQASPNAPNLRVVLDNETIGDPFRYTNNTGYVAFRTGERTLAFGPSGASNIVADVKMTFVKDKAYSIFLVDTFNEAEVLVLNDSTSLPASGKAKIRFLNLSPDSPEVNLLAEGIAGNVFTGQAFKENSDFVELDAKTYTFLVKSADGEIVLSIPNSVLREGRAYTVIVRGFNEPPSGNTNVLSAELID